MNLRRRTWYLMLIAVFAACTNSKPGNEVHELSKVPELIVFEEPVAGGIFIVKQQELVPDSNGIIAQIKLELPGFQQGVYYRPFSEKIAAGNRVEPLWFGQIADLDSLAGQKPRMDDFLNLGTFMMLKQNDGQYLALLPLVSSNLGNSFSIDKQNVFLTMATYGTATENISAPLLSFARSDNPYEAAREAWKLAMDTEGIKGNIDWRENKVYPEAYQYLGWCSWEHYRQNINEEIILNAISEVKSSPIPFRWVLVDDGYLHQKQGQLLSFGVDPKKFPNGWAPITSLKDEKIKWMGIWRNFNGYMGGVSPEHIMPQLQEYFRHSENYNKQRYMPKITPEAANAFYHEMTADTKNNGFDMIKVDFQSDNFRYNTGSENAILGVHYNNAALEENCKSKGLQLLNCIAQQNFNVFNHKYSALIRGSVDYKITKDRLDVTLVQNFANAFWLGHTHWLDQDMFFANFEETARLMAVARAVSGGPVYLSDEPQNIDDTVLKPLTFADGRILGTLAPGVPLPESLMQDPYYTEKAFRVIAPLKNNCAAVLAVNLSQNDSDVNSFIAVTDYPFAGAMIQPYEGLWEIPEEGVLLYDYYAREARKLAADYTFTLGSRKERLFQLSPILQGWSVIGRPDKYLPAAGFQLLKINAESLTIKMVEDGPVVLWTDNKVPVSDSFEFIALKDGLWRGELTRPNANKEYVIAVRVSN